MNPLAHEELGKSAASGEINIHRENEMMCFSMNPGVAQDLFSATVSALQLK